MEVAGFSLPMGMLYVGRRVPAVKGWANEVEPALIDPSQTIDRRAPDFAGTSMPYWPSYSTIPAPCRSAYLQWLAGGRAAADAYIGYVFLFFYGLERRLLYDSRGGQVPAAEIDAIRLEVERLLSIYGRHHSFRRYASAFHGVAILLRRSIDVDALNPPMEREGWELPPTTRIVLGVLAKEGKPLTAEWALSWVMTAPEVALRTPAQRCPHEFRALFMLRYRESFGEGIRLPSNGSRLKIEYHPASASFGGTVTLTIDVPDVARAMATLEPLRSLAGQCAQELDPYSRWVGRTGETSSPPAVALLPSALARGRGDAATLALIEWLEAQLADRQLALIESSELLARWPSKEDGRSSRRELATLSDFLASRGLGIEPDVTFGGPALNRGRRAVLFRLHAGQRETPSPAFEGAAVLLQLAAMVVTADGEVSVAEERHLMEHVEAALHLAPSDRMRLEARFHYLAADPPTFARARKGLEGVADKDRQALGVFLISLAGADGHLDPGEVRVLSKVYALLGLDPQSVYSDVHQLMSAQAPPAREPVPVRPAEMPRGFIIPRLLAAEPVPRAVELDLDKVRAKLAETERVSHLLAAIFVNEEETAATPPPAVATTADEFAVCGLDGAHSALLLTLAGSPSWERVRVERLADALGLLSDGALDVINEAAFGACGAPLLEGDELIEVDQEVLREMLP